MSAPECPVKHGQLPEAPAAPGPTATTTRHPHPVIAAIANGTTTTSKRTTPAISTPAACPVAATATGTSINTGDTNGGAVITRVRDEGQPAATAAYIVKEAASFLKQLRSERGERGSAKRRLAEVRAEIAATGSYRHTTEELTRGAKIAWRNTPRCLGKFYWNALATRDMRHLTTTDEVFEAIVEHLRLTTNNGRIKLIITIFGQDQAGHPPMRIWNSQLVSYAGYRQPDGSIIGDPARVDLTETVQALGWRGAGTPFDVLPIVLQARGQPPKLYQLPPDVVLEVPLRHSEFPWLAGLGLRWYAFPSICDQRLEIGGISYSLAPFSAWYTAAEIGARDLSDTGRYNMLPVIAERMGLDTSSDRTLWKDRAMLELTTAVIHSFDAAGISLIDHHFASRQFVKHELREQAHGRPTPAHWELIVPPTGGSATPLWERRYQPTILRPNFFAQSSPYFPEPVLVMHFIVHRRDRGLRGGWPGNVTTGACCRTANAQPVASAPAARMSTGMSSSAVSWAGTGSECGGCT